MSIWIAWAIDHCQWPVYSRPISFLIEYTHFCSKLKFRVARWLNRSKKIDEELGTKHHTLKMTKQDWTWIRIYKPKHTVCRHCLILSPVHVFHIEHRSRVNKRAIWTDFFGREIEWPDCERASPRMFGRLCRTFAWEGKKSLALECVGLPILVSNVRTAVTQWNN